MQQQSIVLVGVGGTGLSSLAYLFHDLWYTNIVGIDAYASEITNKLEQYGIPVIIWRGEYQVQQNDIVIYSDAAELAPEVQAAHQKTLHNQKRVFPPLTYFQFLGEISKYFTTISIAGTHGKSTTTALTWTSLAKHHPDFWLAICGAGVTPRQGKNYLSNPQYTTEIKKIVDHILFPKGQNIEAIIKKYLFVIEADEYNYHFLHLDTDYALITNIELDHADVYSNFKNYLDTFLQFAHKVKQKIFLLPDAPGINSFLKAQSSDSNANKTSNYSPNKEITLHSSSQQNMIFQVHAWKHETEGVTKIIKANEQTFSFSHLLGAHNHANASLAFACSHYLCKPTRSPLDKEGGLLVMKDLEASLIKSLSTFSWLRRRGELLGHNKHGVPIISDYGHHPTELASTLRALQEKYVLPLSEGKGAEGWGEITCIFQPHQARRVMEFRDDFTEILQKFDTCIIYDIYAARENLEELIQQSQISHNRHSSDLIAPWTKWTKMNKSYPKSPHFPNLSSFSNLWHLFAKYSWWIYTTDFKDIKNTLDTTTEGVIIIFTAGNLDWEVRKWIWI